MSNKSDSIIIKIGMETHTFKVPRHTEIKHYYDTGADSLYDASRQLILACAKQGDKIHILVDAKPAVVPQIAIQLLRMAGSRIDVHIVPECLPESE